MNKVESDKKLRILFINLYTEMGGGEYALYYLLREIDGTRFHPVVMFNNRGPYVDKIESLGIETVIIPYPAIMLKELIRPVKLLGFTASVRTIFKYFRKHKVDVIHCHDVLSLLLIAVPVLILRIPVIYSVIFYYEWSRVLLFNLLSILLVDRIITHSSIVREDLQKRTIFLSRRITTIHQGVDTTICRPRRTGEKNILRSELKIPDTMKVIGMVGRFDPLKGHEIFLKAASLVLLQKSDIKFVIVGGFLMSGTKKLFENYHHKILEYCQQLHLDRHVIFLGHRDDIPDILRSLDGLVIPSYHEGYSLVLLEGLASGIPVVASRRVGALEVVKGHDGLFIAEPDEPSSFAEKILEMMAYAQNNPNHSPDAIKFSSISWSHSARLFENVSLSIFNAQGITD